MSLAKSVSIGEVPPGHPLAQLGNGRTLGLCLYSPCILFSSKVLAEFSGHMSPGWDGLISLHPSLSRFEVLDPKALPVLFVPMRGAGALGIARELWIATL